MKSYLKDKPFSSKFLGVHSPLLAIVLMSEVLMVIYKSLINMNEAKKTADALLNLGLFYMNVIKDRDALEFNKIMHEKDDLFDP
jgi:hypothetical protein